MKRSDNVCAGIVLFNPAVERLKLVIESICQQVEEVVLVDNGSVNIDIIASIIKSYTNVSLIRNNSNEGIAKALNQICCYSFEKGYEWCLTLDHDTVCQENMVSHLLTYSNDSTIGIVCPRVDYEDVNIKQKNVDRETTDVYACMTSGSLTNLVAWKNISGFCENYFIDYVDNEFCMRLGLAGYRIVRVNSCIMHHQLGESVKMKFLNLFPISASRHTPWRYYYMTRNNLLFIKKYRKNLNVLKECLKLGSILLGGLLYAGDRKSTFSFIRKGWLDASKGISGKLS